jgi:hypothetical protein
MPLPEYLLNPFLYRRDCLPFSKVFSSYEINPKAFSVNIFKKLSIILAVSMTILFHEVSLTIFG